MPRLNYLRDPAKDSMAIVLGGRTTNLAALARAAKVSYAACADYRGGRRSFAVCTIENFAKLCKAKGLSDEEILKAVKVFWK